MPDPRPNRPVSRFRLLLRWARRMALVACLALGGTFIYLNQAGLPDSVKRRLVAELRTRGVVLDYGQMRLRLGRGIVAEGVTLGAPDAAEGLELSIPELALSIDPLALLRLRLQVRAIEIEEGRLVLPVAVTNEPLARLAVDRISAEIQFPPDDRWELTRFTAETLGVRLHLSGQLTNASAIREWRPPAAAATLATETPWQHRLRRFMRTVQQFEFSQPPELHLDLRGDARLPLACALHVRFAARDARTQWGNLGRLLATAHLNEATEQFEVGRSTLQVEALEVQTPWSEIGRTQLDVQWTQALTNAIPVAVDWQLQLESIYTPWGETPELHFTASGRQAPHDPRLIYSELRLASGNILSGLVRSGTNRFSARLLNDSESILPLAGDWDLEVRQPEFAWGNAESLRLGGRVERAQPIPSPGPPAWGAWGWFVPLRLALNAEATHLNVSNVIADRVLLDARWSAPELTLDRLHAELGGRTLESSARLNVAERRVDSQLRFDLDVHRLDPLLPPKVRQWLLDYGWQPDLPPAVEARVQCRLPEWTAPPEEFQPALASTLGIDGVLQATNVAYKGIPMDTVRFEFHHTNAVWHLHNFEGTAPEGRLRFEYTENTRTKEYRFDLVSELDPNAVRPLVPPQHHRAFDLFQFGRPPVATGVVQGRWKAGGVVGFTGDLRLTNFVFRGEAVESLAAHLEYTNANGFLAARGISLRSEGLVEADGVGFDTRRQWLYLTNAQSTVDPLRVARVIGPQVLRTLEPYRFHAPPRARVDGFIDVQNTRNAGLRVDLAGGPFTYWRFNIPDIRGSVLWSNQTVAIHDVRSSQFYGGQLDANIDVDLAAESQGARFGFRSRVDQVDLRPLIADLLSPTNRLAGRLSGEWTVTEADSDDWHSWQGYGRAELRDGYLWDVPLFGAVSGVLETISPGLGHSRVHGLTATFGLTNSILHTSDLQLRSPAMRLDYRGTFDFQGAVDARVEARLLRETAVLGPVVSFLFTPITKLMELRVTGTLGNPKTEPIYIPKPLLFPLNPIGTLKELFTPPPKEAAPPPP